MKYFFKKQWVLIIVILFLSLLFFLYYNRAIFFKKLFLSPSIAESTPSSLLESNIINKKTNSPLRLKIPSIGVDTTIEYVGLTSDGEMGVPQKDSNVAWFNLGPVPGEEGSAVIAGHFTGEDDKKAVFFNLEDVKKGDQLFVEDVDGNIITFVVKYTNIYDSKAIVPEIFNSSGGKHLNLITCSGDWNELENEYQKRLVVFTDLE